MLPTSERTSSRQFRTRQPRDARSRRVVVLPGIATRLRHALAIAGVPPDTVEARIQMTPVSIDVQLVPDAGSELTLDQLAIVAAALRIGEASDRIISTRVA